MDYLWTPWRYRYLSKPADKNERCIFCDIAAAPNEDDPNNVVYRGRKNFIILNLFPYTSGHVMIVPFEHQPSLVSLDEETGIEMLELSKQMQTAMEKEYRPHGLNIGINLGAAAGAGVADHLHLHIVPRWFGDANFMTAIGETRVLPEELFTTCERLRKHFPAHNGANHA